MSQSTGNALIVGLGKTGVSVARHLTARGWQLSVTDTRVDPPGVGELKQIAPKARCGFGAFDAALLSNVDLVVASPGVSAAEPLLQSARSRGIEIIGDIELFAREVQAPVIGITGTNGKSTVTTLVGRMAARAGVAVAVGGNLGAPALDLLASGTPELFVLELSSFQLDTTFSLRLRAATVLNVTEDHLDRYGTMQAYAASKARIFERCEHAVLNLDDPLVARMLPSGSAVSGFSIASVSGARYHLATVQGAKWLAIDAEPVMALHEMRLGGLHNAANALAALALGDAAGLPREAMLAELREFSGLPHRSQWVGEHAGVRYVNDSKGTNVGATLAAVCGHEGGLIVIAGGDGKGQDFSPLASAFAGRVRHTFLIGRDASRIAEALHGICPADIVASLDEAVQRAAQVAVPGDTVLMSPACASLDMFRDYAQRGDLFAAAVGRLT
jgi:UDP-N-acetylmuramoylalanine--D-glutamate ligase